MRPALKAAVAVLAAILAHPSLLHADPFVVRSGGIAFDTGDPPLFGFSGDGFEVRGLFPAIATTGALTCGNTPCFPGTPVDLSTVFGGPTRNFDLGQGVAVINGVEYGSETGPPGEGYLFLTGTLSFEAPAIPIPAGGDPVVRLTAPFLFEGSIVGSNESPVVLPLFDLTLTGRGTARMRLDRENGTYQFVAVDYVFTDPIPEPATLLLVGTGAALAFRPRRVKSEIGNRK
jgi:hypothetical protein